MSPAGHFTATMNSEPDPTLDALLAQSDWVAALARSLVADAATADDVAQATWLDVLRRPPRALADARAWLARLVHRKVGRQRRSESRRRQHEANASAANDAVYPSAAELDERLRAQAALVAAVAALPEPYRSTVVLRYFDRHDLATIAARSGNTVNTVRSRLQRALQQLRERLDGDGGRERWWPGMCLLAQRPTVLPMATGTAGMPSIVMVLAMKKTLVAAALVAAGSWFAWPSRQPSPPHDLAASHPAPHVTSTAGVATGVRADEAPGRTSSPVGMVAPRASRRRLVDQQDRPLAGVVMRACSPHAVRWQGGDRGWIASAERSLFLGAEDEQRLRDDGRFAGEFFAQFAHPEEWRATILGAPLPLREVTTAPDGSFDFAADSEASDASIDVADPRFVLLAKGDGVGPWRAGPRTRVTGTVRTVDGAPLPDAFARPLDPNGGGASLLSAPEVRSDDAGVFLVRAALAGGLLAVRCDGFAPACVPLGDAPEQVVDVVLARRVATVGRRVEGTVVDAQGRPIANAKVWFGRNEMRTAADGRFGFAAAEPRPRDALTVLAKGHGFAQRDGLGAEVAASPNGVTDLWIVLAAPAPPLRGVVLGNGGQPVAGALVGMVDPTLLDITFTSVEGQAAGYDEGVATAPDGTFELAGLAARSYRVRAIDPATGNAATSPPHRPGHGDLVLRLPDTGAVAVRGIVQMNGAPLAGATIAIAQFTHVTKGGGTRMWSAPAHECDADGRFVLPTLPRREAWLVVRHRGKVQQVVPVEALVVAANGDLEVACDGTRWLQLVGSEHPTTRLVRLERSNGAIAAAATAGGAVLLERDGRCPPVRLPDDAAFVLVGDDGPDCLRLDLTDDRAVHLRVR